MNYFQIFCLIFFFIKSLPRPNTKQVKLFPDHRTSMIIEMLVHTFLCLFCSRCSLVLDFSFSLLCLHKIRLSVCSPPWNTITEHMFSDLSVARLSKSEAKCEENYCRHTTQPVGCVRSDVNWLSLFLQQINNMLHSRCRLWKAKVCWNSLSLVNKVKVLFEFRALREGRSGGKFGFIANWSNPELMLCVEHVCCEKIRTIVDSKIEKEYGNEAYRSFVYM